MIRVLIACLLLLSGLFVYWLFRPEIALFQWLHITNPHPLEANSALLLLISNHFSDTVWCIALLLIVTFLKERKVATVYFALLLTLPFLGEILQLVGVIKGTFDWVDIFIYVFLFTAYYLRELLCAK